MEDAHLFGTWGRVLVYIGGAELSRSHRPDTTLRTPPSTAMISPLTYSFLAR
jgi:hypothetical protein